MGLNDRVTSERSTAESQLQQLTKESSYCGKRTHNNRSIFSSFACSYIAVILVRSSSDLNRRFSKILFVPSPV